jgi:chitinase
MEKSNQTTRRKLSLPRLLFAVLVFITFGGGVAYGIRKWNEDRIIGPHNPWFAAYVDVTATPLYQFENLGSTAHKDAVLSFIVSMPGKPCTPSWGGAYTLNQASSSLDLDRRIARLQEQGGSIAVSFGGKLNQELADKCTNQQALYSAYQSVIERYKVDTIDLDLEGSTLDNYSAMVRRAEVIAKLQSSRRSSGQKLAVWLTLPVTTQGLSLAGTNAVATMLSHGVDLAGVNIMVMDFGQSLAPGQNMLNGSESAAIQTVRQLGILYKQAGIYLNNGTLWSKLGLTPMIGVNDDSNEIFSLADAKSLNAFALSNHVGRMSMWSANRDLTCGSNYVTLSIVSDSCSGINEGAAGTFADLLGNGFKGSIELSAGLITKADIEASYLNTPDNPATSPYPIWSPNSAYLEGTKVVWHHNVYEAKWWTQGDVPDDPVLQTWQTPWELIGPVLPGEKPVPQATLPAGTYPNWSGTTIYNTGDRVLFNGVPYQAKWWNEGQSPAAASSDPGGSPWAPLTQAQINAIENKTS